MTRILVAGLCPLPFENTLQNYGPGIRTWQFARSLADDGHEVHVIAMQIPGVYGEDDLVTEETVDGIRIERWTDGRFLDTEQMRAAVERIQPEALVGATVYGSFALAQVAAIYSRHAQGPGPVMPPFWADQFGQVMAEAQAKAFLDRKNWVLSHFWKMVRLVGRHADKVSSVSERQRFAVIGELGALGRLTWETCGYDLTSVIPCAMIPDQPAETEPVLRGDRVPEDAFIVLWSGGFNVWSDVDTLYEGLVTAMERDDRVHLVATGGGIRGHDDRTYERFCERVEESPLADRFHLEGWVRSALVPRYVGEADLGVLTERPIYEGLLGSKNRIVQWMGVGLPVAYNHMGDLGDLLVERDLGLTFELGRADELAERILWAARHPDELASMAERARKYTLDELTFEATTADLRVWARTPCHAPDVAHRSRIQGPADHAGAHQKVAEVARQVPGVGDSSRLRRWWNRLTARAAAAITAESR